MAHVAMQSLQVTQGIAVQDIPEGSAVVISASGAHFDLPNVSLAAANSTNVYIAIIPPDEYERPTPIGLFSRPDLSRPSPRNAARIYSQPFTELRLAPSLIEDMTALSGWALQLHRGGAYTIESGRFNTVPTQGAAVYLAASGRFDTSGSVTVAQCREVRDGKVTIIWNV